MGERVPMMDLELAYVPTATQVLHIKVLFFKTIALKKPPKKLYRNYRLCTQL